MRGPLAKPEILRGSCAPVVQGRSEIKPKPKSEFLEALRDDVGRRGRLANARGMDRTLPARQELRSRRQRLKKPERAGDHRRGTTELLTDDLNQVPYRLRFRLDVIVAQARLGPGHREFKTL